MTGTNTMQSVAAAIQSAAQSIEVVKRESKVPRLLIAVIASALVLGPAAAIGQTLDTSSPKTTNEYKMAKDSCKTPGQAGREQCAKDLKALEEASRTRCGKLTDQAKRECVLEAFVDQHDRMIPGARVEKSEGAPSAGVQPR
jgi:hypothetical protein